MHDAYLLTTTTIACIAAAGTLFGIGSCWALMRLRTNSIKRRIRRVDREG